MSAPASSSASPRRRLLAWRASVDGDAPPSSPKAPRAGAATGRVPCEYASPARPECQAALASHLPVRFSRLALAVAAILLVAVAVALPMLWPAPLDALVRAAGPRFSRSTAIVRDLCDPRGGRLAGWLAQMFLLSAAAVALSIRGMRRHRRDGRHGRARAWGAMTLVLGLAATAAPLRVGDLVAAFLADATGIALGPEGRGWWVVVAGSITTAVVLWTTLPLHDRAAPMAWCVLGLGGWAVAAALPWLGTMPWPTVPAADPHAVVATAWLAGSAALFVAMLVAARGVIREVRGERTACGRHAASITTAASGKPAPRVETPTPIEATDADEEPAEEPEEAVASASSDTRYTDGTELEDDYASRPLSKAEKKRLRRLARTGQAA